jgi:hypothetical protein
VNSEQGIEKREEEKGIVHQGSGIWPGRVAVKYLKPESLRSPGMPSGVQYALQARGWDEKSFGFKSFEFRVRDADLLYCTGFVTRRSG